MKRYLIVFSAMFLLTVPAAAQTVNGLCVADASGNLWYTKTELVVREGKPQGITQFISGNGPAKKTEFTDFAAGTGTKQGWLRLEFAQDSRGQRQSITIFAPAMEKDEMVGSHRIKLKAGDTVLFEGEAEPDGFYAGWPTGTTRILAVTLKDPGTVLPVLRALDKVASVTVETVAVFLDKSQSNVAAFTVSAEALKQSRDAAPAVKTKMDAAFKEGTCRSLK